MNNVLLYLELLLFVTLAHSQTSQMKTVPIGDSVRFNCYVREISSTTWTFLKRGISSGGRTLVQGSHSYNEDQHKVTTHPNETILEVLNSDEDDEGTYSCQEGGAENAVGDLTVEIPPVVQLMIDGVTVNDTIDVVFTKQVSIQCVAKGGKPSVSLSWQVNGQNKTDGVIIDLSQEDERLITSTFTYLPNLEDKTVTCITSGQEAIPSKSVNTRVNVISCPNEYLVVEDMCFRKVEELLNFDDARETCHQDGAELASASTPHKNTIVSGIADGQRCWIGAYVIGEEYTWINGDTWEFTNWRKREPNWHKKPLRACIETNFVRATLWNDHFCHSKRSSVCEKPLLPEPEI